MRSEVVLTLTGPDRVGIVEDVTKALLALGGNVETSRMARLGGAFSILALVALPAEAVDRIDEAFADLAATGYTVAVSPTAPAPEDDRAAWLPYDIEVTGADHEGIVHHIAQGLSQRGITIESAETTVTEAAITGAPLFSMKASVLVPPTVGEIEWQESLALAAENAGVDVTVVAG